jgi:hypothetical protein
MAPVAGVAWVDEETGLLSQAARRKGEAGTDIYGLGGVEPPFQRNIVLGYLNELFSAAECGSVSRQRSQLSELKLRNLWESTSLRRRQHPPDRRAYERSDSQAA